MTAGAEQDLGLNTVFANHNMYRHRTILPVYFAAPNPPIVALNQAATSITVIITRPTGGVDFYTISCSGDNRCPEPITV